MKNIKLLLIGLTIAIMTLCLGQSTSQEKKEHMVTANFNVDGMVIKGGFL